MPVFSVLFAVPDDDDADRNLTSVAFAAAIQEACYDVGGFGGNFLVVARDTSDQDFWTRWKEASTPLDAAARPGHGGVHRC